MANPIHTSRTPFPVSAVILLGYIISVQENTENIYPELYIYIIKTHYDGSPVAKYNVSLDEYKRRQKHKSRTSIHL